MWLPFAVFTVPLCTAQFGANLVTSVSIIPPTFRPNLYLHVALPEGQAGEVREVSKKQ
jgi:hypothetical protein